MKANRYVSIWIDKNTLDMRVTAEGGLHVQSARWSSWMGLLRYLRAFDPAIYNMSVKVYAPKRGDNWIDSADVAVSR